MNEQFVKFKTQLDEIYHAITHIKPPMPNFMYDDIRNAMPEESHQSLEVLERHLTENIESIQSALDKIHCLGEAQAKLIELRQELAEQVYGELIHNNLENQDRLREIWDRVDNLSVGQEDKSRILSCVDEMLLELKEMETYMKHFSKLHDEAYHAATHAIDD
jgi:hypothetical protein